MKTCRRWAWVAFVALTGAVFSCSDEVTVATELPPPGVKMVGTEKPVATASVKTTPTKAVGLSRDHPVPVGSMAIVEKIAIRVVSGVRPADTIVAAGNMFNTKPEAGMEYLMVEVSLSCEKPSNEKCSLFASSFSAVGSSGLVREKTWMVSGVQGMLETGDFFGGAKKNGKTFYLVGKDEKDVVLFYDVMFGADVYFALPDPAK